MLDDRDCWVFDLDGTLTIANHDFDAIRAELGIPEGHLILEYQATLPEHAGPFSLPGMMPTVADMCLVPQLYNARRFSLEMSELPRLLEIEERCMSHPAFERSHPDQQPDAQ